MPVKAFVAAKQRLAPVLQPAERRRLARWMADRVLDACAELPVYVACDDEDVRDWADARGARVLWGPGLGLNGAVDDGVRRIAADGIEHVSVTHSDLPLADGIPTLAVADRTTLVPDRRRDGTNVMSFPVERAIRASYGGGSFRRHLAAAAGSTEVRFDPRLSLDVDTPSDLAHPLLREVLPPWLPTIPVNRFIRVAP